MARGSSSMRPWGLGVVVLALVLAQQQQVVGLEEQDGFTIIPDVKPWPKTRPVDTGYPGNIPRGLPSTVPPAPSVLQPGAGGCATTVREVLTKNGRTAFISLLSASAEGRSVLDGTMKATVLAPTDAALAAMKLTGANVDPLQASMIGQYHVLQGRLPLQQMLVDPGLWLNTSLTKASCPTAFQTLTVLPGNSTAVKPSPEAYVRGAENTARITAGDLPACNSVVHLLDAALQPCCTSVFEQLPQFSIVKIQPSYFDGYRQQAPPTNDDASNRRLFEEGMVDLLLYMNRKNSTKTMLWPQPSAWDNFKLGDYLPSSAIDSVQKRTRALRVLALYSLSYQISLLPKDTPAADGTAPGVAFQFQSALHNLTDGKKGLWECDDSLRVVALPLTAPVDVTTDKLLPASSKATELNFVPTNTPLPQDPAAAAADAPPPEPAAPKAPAKPVQAPALAPAPAPAPAPKVAPEAAAAALPVLGALGPFKPTPIPQAPVVPLKLPAPAAAAAPAPVPAAAAAASKAAPIPAPAAAKAPAFIGPPMVAAAPAADAADVAAANEAFAAAADGGVSATAPAAGGGGPAKPAGAAAAAPAEEAAVDAGAADAAAADAGAADAGAADAGAAADTAAEPATDAIVPSAEPAGPAAPAAEPAAANRRRLQQHRRAAPFGGGAAAAAATPAAAAAPARRRALLDAAKASTVVNAYETCEGVRILVIDAVPVPCNFDKLVSNYDKIEEEMEDQFFDPPAGTIASYYYDWLVKKGLNRVPAAGTNAAGGGYKTCSAVLPLAAAAVAVAAGQLLLF